MTGLARVTIEKKNGALGGVEPSNDGESLLMVGSFGAVYYDNLLPETTILTSQIFKSYSSFEEFEIEYPSNIDSLEGMMFKHHVKKYFEASSSKLHVMRYSKAVKVNDLFTIDNANYTLLKNYLEEQNGSIKLIGIAQNPSWVETSTDGVATELIASIEKVQSFVDNEFAEGRPVHVLIEGRGVNFSSNTLVNLRSLEASNVSVVAWQSTDIASSIPSSVIKDGETENFLTLNSRYAEVGYTLGLISSQPVQRNIGRVRNGRLSYSNNIASSSGQLVQSIAKTTRNTVADKGYIFARKHPQLDGWYISDDPTCTALIDDYSWITRNRVINKAAIITRRVYNQSILDEVYVDPDTGLLSALTIKNFEADVENAINLEMIRNGEATAVEAYVDPAQDVLTTGEIIIDIRIVPVGVARYITAKIGFSKVI